MSQRGLTALFRTIHKWCNDDTISFITKLNRCHIILFLPRRVIMPHRRIIVLQSNSVNTEKVYHFRFTPKEHFFIKQQEWENNSARNAAQVRQKPIASYCNKISYMSFDIFEYKLREIISVRNNRVRTEEWETTVWEFSGVSNLFV